MPGITQIEIDQRVYDLYDEYCHGRIDRREFLSRAASIAVIGGTGLDQPKLRTDLLNSAQFLKAHQLSTRKLGVTGFCFGGGIVNFLAAAMGADMHAGAPYYGVAADAASVSKVKAPLVCHRAENDERINATYPAYSAALKTAGVAHEVHTYPGTQHGFHNNSTPRFNEPAAKLSWERTIAHFKKHLG